MKKNNRKSNALCKLSTGAADKRRHLKTGFKIWGIKETNFRHQEISSSLMTPVCYVPATCPAPCSARGTRLLSAWFHLRFWPSCMERTEGQLKILCHRSSTAVQLYRLGTPERYFCVPNLVLVGEVWSQTACWIQIHATTQCLQNPKLVIRPHEAMSSSMMWCHQPVRAPL